MAEGEILETTLLTWSRYWGPFLFMGMMLAVMAVAMSRRYLAASNEKREIRSRAAVNLLYGIVLVVWTVAALQFMFG